MALAKRGDGKWLLFGASRYSAAASMFNAIKNHKNHIGPVGVFGNAAQCDKYADQLGSTAVSR